jgi:hypothetical protein
VGTGPVTAPALEFAQGDTNTLHGSGEVAPTNFTGTVSQATLAALDPLLGGFTFVLEPFECSGDTRTPAALCRAEASSRRRYDESRRGAMDAMPLKSRALVDEGEYVDLLDSCAAGNLNSVRQAPSRSQCRAARRVLIARWLCAQMHPKAQRLKDLHGLIAMLNEVRCPQLPARGFAESEVRCALRHVVETARAGESLGAALSRVALGSTPEDLKSIIALNQVAGDWLLMRGESLIEAMGAS